MKLSIIIGWTLNTERLRSRRKFPTETGRKETGRNIRITGQFNEKKGEQDKRG